MFRNNFYYKLYWVWLIEVFDELKSFKMSLIKNNNFRYVEFYFGKRFWPSQREEST